MKFAVESLMISRLNNRNTEFGASQIYLPNGKHFFIGSLMDARNFTSLHEHNITHIITVAGGLSVFSDETFHHKKDFHNLVLQIADHPSADMFKILPQCFHFMDECLSQYKIPLVHCASGVSRSVTVSVLYLMSRFSLSDVQVVPLSLSVRYKYYISIHTCTNKNIILRVFV